METLTCLWWGHSQCYLTEPAAKHTNMHLVQAWKFERLQLQKWMDVWECAAMYRTHVAKQQGLIQSTQRQLVTLTSLPVTGTYFNSAEEKERTTQYQNSWECDIKCKAYHRTQQYTAQTTWYQVQGLPLHLTLQCSDYLIECARPTTACNFTLPITLHCSDY